VSQTGAAWGRRASGRVRARGGVLPHGRGRHTPWPPRVASRATTG